MIRRTETRRGDKVVVTFVLPERGGGNVFIAGDFNSWTLGKTPLRRRDGVRAAVLCLLAGRRYAFRYYQDGLWFNDEDVDTYGLNPDGGKNGVLDLREILPVG